MSIETLATGYGLIEGPRLDADDNLYFSDVPNGGVYRRSPGGQIDVVVPKRRGVGGITLHADGGIVISGRDICHVKDGQSRSLFSKEDIPGFNDIFADAEGRVYAGSMRSDPFKGSGPRTPGELWRIDAAGEAVELYGGVSLTNGIGFSPDGRRLYHADTAPQCIRVHEIAPDGRASPLDPIDVKPDNPDGLAVDEAGCIWVALYGAGAVGRFTPEGKLDRKLEVPAKSVTSVCFGGSDLRDLYVVTADNSNDASLGGSIFRTRSDVAGLPAPLARI